MTGMFVDDFPKLKLQLEAAYLDRAAAERERDRSALELQREQARCVTLEEELGRQRDEREQAVRRVSELTAVVAKVPLVEAARDAAETRANQLSTKLDVAKEKLAEGAEREKEFVSTIAERDREVSRLTGDLESSRLIVEAVRRVEADVRIIAATVATS